MYVTYSDLIQIGNIHCCPCWSCVMTIFKG